MLLNPSVPGEYEAVPQEYEHQVRHAPEPGSACGWARMALEAMLCHNLRWCGTSDLLLPTQCLSVSQVDNKQVVVKTEEGPVLTVLMAALRATDAHQGMRVAKSVSIDA